MGNLVSFTQYDNTKSYEFQAASCKFQVASSKLLIPSCELRVASCEFQVASSKLRALFLSTEGREIVFFLTEARRHGELFFCFFGLARLPEFLNHKQDACATF